MQQRPGASVRCLDPPDVNDEGAGASSSSSKHGAGPQLRCLPDRRRRERQKEEKKKRIETYPERVLKNSFKTSTTARSLGLSTGELYALLLETFTLVSVRVTEPTCPTKVANWTSLWPKSVTTGRQTRDERCTRISSSLWAQSWPEVR
eukprot:superscaffoldBa00005773_g20764